MSRSQRWYISLPLLILALTGVYLTSAPANRAQDLAQDSAGDPGGALLVENVGQFDPGAGFMMDYGAARVWLEQDAIWLQVFDPAITDDPFTSFLEDTEVSVPGENLRLSFVGANSLPGLVPFDPRDEQVSYLIGADRSGWHPDVPVWGGVRYEGLYPGIDLVLDGEPALDHRAALSWRAEAQPGGDLSDLRLRVEGAQDVRIEDNQVIITTSFGEYSLPALQLTSLEGVSLPAARAEAAVTQDGTGAFEIAVPWTTENQARMVESTSVTGDLVYSSYLGGGSWESGYAVAIDGAGSAYLSGSTPSSDFPTTPGAFSTSVQAVDMFVSKFNAEGSELVYSTYIGGSAQDTAWSIAVEAGIAYLAGETWSSDFPLTGGVIAENDAVVLALNETGSDLLYATLLGGSDQEVAYGVAVEAGAAYLTGITYSRDFPAEGYNNTGDLFVSRVDGSGAVQYATLVGGRNEDAGFGIAVRDGQAYVTGQTWSPDFPASGYQGEDDVPVLVFDSSGSLSQAVLLGGSDQDSANAITLSGTGDIYLAGETTSTDFPVTEGAPGGDFDAFLVRLDSSAAVQYATYLGGSGRDEGRGIGLDRYGGIVVGGLTLSTDFPVTGDAHQAANNGGYDAFATRYDLEGGDPGKRSYSSYLGGTESDRANSLAVDPDGYVFLAGYTQSTDFPTTSGAYDTSLSGTQDAFVAKMLVSPYPGIALEKYTNGADADSPPGVYIPAGEAVTWTYQVSNTGTLVLNDVTVSDDQGLTISCPQTTLLVNESMTCTASGNASAGQYANLGTASGTPLNGEPVEDSDPSHYFGAEPQVSLVKKTNDQDANSPPGVYILTGDPVTWTYLVSNDGNVPLSKVTVIDDNGTPSNSGDDITVCTIASLEAGAQQTCTLSGTAAPGQYANTATASGTPPGGLAGVSDSDPSHYYGSDPQVALLKKTNGQVASTPPGPYILVGENITWTYEVSNTGNADLSNVTVTDDSGTPGNTSDDVIVCVIETLNAGANTTCSQEGAAIAGQYANTARVSAIPPVGSTLEETSTSHYFGADPLISLQKSTNGQDADSAPGPYILVGEPVSWTYQVSNQGNVLLSEVTVSDDNGTPSEPGDDLTVCSFPSLAPSETQTCTLDGSAASGQYANLATASGTPPVGPQVSDTDPSHYFGSQPAVSLEVRTNGQDADSAPGPYILAGEPVSWSYQVSNTGNVALSDIVIRDDNGTPANPNDDVTVCTIASLAAGAQQTCSRSGSAVVGQYANTGSLAATPPAGPELSGSDPSHYFGASPAISLQKLTNDQDADSAPGPYILIGEPVSWEYQVTNTGNVALSEVTVSDDRGTPSDPGDDFTVCSFPSLAPSETQSCTIEGSADDGQYANLGTASATPPVGPQVSDTDPSHYYGATASLDLVKNTNGQDADSAPGPYILVGSTVNWVYDVTNTGEVELSNLTISDDNGTPSEPGDDFTVCTISSLAAGATRSCSFSGSASAGQYANLGSVSGSYQGTQVSASDPSHYFGANPVIQVEKSTNGQDADSAPGPYILVGEPVNWEYRVSNQGNVDLSSVTVTDDNGTPSSTGDDITVCTIASLAAGAQQTCTHSATASPGQYTNTARARGTPPGGLSSVSDSDPSNYFGADPLIGLQKSTNGQDADSAPGPYILVGEPVSWSYQVSNQGNVALSEVTVSDDNGTPSDPGDDLAVCTIASLAIGETQTCSSSGTAVSGQYSNQAESRATPPGGLTQVEATDISHYFGAQPSLNLAKRTNGQEADSAPGPGILVGDPVEWSYQVTNTGNVALSEVTVSDNNGTPSDLTDDITVCVIANLGAGASQSCTLNSTAVAGQYANLGSVSGTPPTGDKVSDTDPSHYFGQAPSISLQKATNGQDADNPPGPTILLGNPVEWVYTVTNDGNVSLSEITVSDDNGTPDNEADDLTVCTIPDLGAGEQETCSHSRTALEGQYSNQATASGVPPQGPLVSDSDASHYYGAPPGILILKDTNGQAANDPPGPYLSIDDPVTWTYQVTNTGEIDLLDITVTDDNGTPENPSDDIVVCTIPSLAPSASDTCSLDSTAQEGQYTNLATASGTPLGGSPLSSSDVSNYFGVSPAIDLVKKANGQDADSPPGPYILAGDPLTWSYTVSNTGNIALSDVTVVDDNGTPSQPADDITVCVLESLGSGSSYTCTLSSTAGVGQYANTATVTGTPPAGETVSASDTSHYFGADVHLDVAKKTNDLDAENPPGPFVLVGENVEWTYDISNAGNVDLTSLAVSDDNGTPDNESDDITVCTISSLAVGASDSCSHSGTAISGQYANRVEVTATPPGDLEPITFSDTSHYFGADPRLEIEKSTNNQDADITPGPYILIGDTVSWTYTVENTGNVLLSNVIVIDDAGTPAEPGDDISVCTISELGVGVTQNCSHSASAVSGQYSNIATATGTPAGGLEDVSDSDPSHYFGTNPVISLVKRTNGQDANSAPGPTINVDDAVSWEYEVTNPGNVPLDDIQVTDDQGIPVSCPQTSLGAGQEMTCTANGIATLGQYANIGTAAGSPPGGLAEVSDSDPSYYYGANPNLKVVKQTNGQQADQPPGPYILVGEQVDWTYTVTNNGNVEVIDISVVDDNGTPSNAADDFTVCTIDTLAVDQSDQCAWTGSAIAGQYGNTATVDGTTSESTLVSDTNTSHYFGSQPNLSLELKTNGEDADTPPGPEILVGETVSWSYEVSNSGNVELNDVTVTDDNGTPSDPADDVTICIIASLPVSATQTCTRTGTAAAGQYANEGKAAADPPGSLAAVSDSDLSHYFGAKPVIEIIKRAAGQDANTPPGPYIKVGDPVTWSYQISNTGNVDLENVVVTDDSGTEEDPGDDVTVCSLPILPSGSQENCEHTGTATAGQYMNTGTVTGTPPIGGQISDSDPSYYFGADLVIEIQKSTNGEDADNAPGPYIPEGDPVTWTYEISNQGNVLLNEVTVIDDNGTPSNPSDDIEVCAFPELAPGATEDCSHGDTATAGQYANSATASGSPPDSLGPVSSTDASHYFGSRADIQIVKKTNGVDANEAPGPSILVGDPVNWTYEVTNTGNLQLSDVEVLDDQGITVSCPKDTLLEAESMTCSASGVAESGQYVNFGTVTGTPPGGLDQVSDSDSSHYLGYTNDPSIDIQKFSNGMNADNPPGPYILIGEEVTWEYLVTNNGNVDLTNIQIVDDSGTPSDPGDDVSVCQISSLSQGSSNRCSLNGTSLAGQYANLATVYADIPGGAQISDTDPSHYYGGYPAVRLVKTTNGFDANEPPGPFITVGDAVTWSYEIHNDGNVALNDLEVIDDHGTPADETDDFSVCLIPDLPAGESTTCQSTSTATAGQYSNQASVSGTPPGGLAAVSDVDLSHYFGAMPSLLLIKKTNGQDAAAPPGPEIPIGDTVTWTYLVNNNGNVVLTDLVIRDDNGTPGDAGDDFTVCTISSLAVSSSQTCTHSGTSVPRQYTNTATATASPPSSLPQVSDSDVSHYYGGGELYRVYLPLIMR